MSKFTGLLKNTFVLVLICILVTVFVAGINLLTKEKIAQSGERRKEDSMETVLPGCDTYALWDAGNVECYAGVDLNREVQGYIFITQAKGYGGTVLVMTGIDTNGVVSGVQILDCDETPGLGLKAKDDAFTSQFEGQIGMLSVVRNKDTKSNEIEALTGATITSDAVVHAVNNAVQAYEDHIKEVTS